MTTASIGRARDGANEIQHESCRNPVYVIPRGLILG